MTTETGTESRRTRTMHQLVRHWQTPLYRTGYLLTINSGLTLGLGLLFWMLAARFYSPEQVGFQSALLAALALLTGLATLGLNSVLLRFIPSAGVKATRLIALAYLASGLTTIVVSLVFVAGVSIWAPPLAIISRDWRWAGAFALATLVWSIFSLQDYALTGLRRTAWIPVENLVFSILKVAALIGFASQLPSVGIFAAWIVPAALTLFPVNFLVLGRFAPQQARNIPASEETLTIGSLTQFMTGNYVGMLFSTIATSLLPLIIANDLGLTANAYFYVPWMLANGLSLFAMNMSTSLTVESAVDPSKLMSFCRQVLKQILWLLCPVIVLILILSDVILSVFGNQYAQAGATTLRLLAVAALPNALVYLAIGIARVQKQALTIALIQGLLCGLSLGLSRLLIPVLGIAGAGLGWLIGQSIVAMVVGIFQLRPLWLGRDRREANEPQN